MMMTRSFVLFFAATIGALTVETNVNAFTLKATPKVSHVSLNSHQMNDEVSRRDLFVKAALSTGVMSSIIAPDMAFAAGAPPTKEELDRIKIGHDQIVYLLNNFERETTVCRVSSSRRRITSGQQYTHFILTHYFIICICIFLSFLMNDFFCLFWYNRKMVENVKEMLIPFVDIWVFVLRQIHYFRLKKYLQR